MSLDTLNINTSDGSFSAHIHRPDGQGPFPVVVLAQEIYGINPAMKALCAQFAERGYIAIAPDLFWRIEPGLSLDPLNADQNTRAFELFGLFDVALGLKDLQATIDLARTLDGANGKVGLSGYCLGGKVAFLSSFETSADAVASYYGVGLDAFLGKAPTITTPMCVHIAQKDGYVPVSTQKALLSAFDGHACVSAYLYEGCDHAFARPNGAHFDAAAAKLANDRTCDLFDRVLKA